jgi:hypothetical protein
MGLLGHWSANIGDNAIPSVVMYGANHSYRTFNANWTPFLGWFDDGAATGILTAQSGNGPLKGLMMRWE